ncbi:MAG TPA: carbohydrate binding domain-containing protein, partial [Verrucomicrobiae bacterium]|nr:carbohydrate binding domain-containing protein [Verrucomicrobiae bacterium]
MKKVIWRTIFWSGVIFQLAAQFAAATTTGVHTSWMWHMHQPIYWPDRAPANHFGDHYQNAYDTIQLQAAGSPVPSDDLSGTFGDVNRINDYSYYPHDMLQQLSGLPNAGGQLNYSGALMENVASLASHSWNGYPSNWNSYNTQAHGWTTSGGKPRMDLTNFTYHHCIAPFVSDETLEMDILIDQREQQLTWGTSGLTSHGFFPAEMCFSERIIPILAKLGISWTVVSGSHLARTCVDFPYMSGSGENIEIPNKADQLNPIQGTGNYWETSIDRGCSPSAVAPFGYQLHYARYVNPSNGVASTIIVVPSDQALGWKDSYSTWDVGLISPIASRNNPAKPSFLLLAHDGDNAWADGYSYWGAGQWADQFANSAASAGYEPTTVEQFLSDFPPATGDVVHVEDGGWAYADQDFGSPIMINWLWPGTIVVNGRNVVDPSAATSDKADEWRTIIATENRVKTAQQITNSLAGGTYSNRIDQIRDPGYGLVAANPVELGWHYYLASLDSGFVYYGCSGTHCASAVVAQSNAVRNVDTIINGNTSLDTTPPTVFIPQRSPWNPGGANFGPEYQLNGNWNAAPATNTDFWVWTYAYDVSGIANVTLLYRSNGSNEPPTQDEFKTYAGGADTGSWVQQPMTKRVVAPVLSASPEYIADYYYTKVTGLSDTYVDYYVTATDTRGNTYNSPIQHVYVSPTPSGGGGGGGSTNGCNGPVCVSPVPPVAGNTATITYTPAGGPIAGASQVYIHLGWNNWATVVSPDAPMTAVSNTWVYATTVPGTATQLDCVFNNGAGTWDNNNGQDWKFAVTNATTTQSPPMPTNVTATAASSNEIDVSWSATPNTLAYLVYRGATLIGTTAGTTYSDLGLQPNTQYCYTVASSNSVGASAQSGPACATTLAGAASPPPPFVMDGAVDSTNYLQTSTNSLLIYAAVRGQMLYVATQSPGSNNSGPNDHFIIVTDQISPTLQPAFPTWSKVGSNAVVSTKPFLGGESINTYVGWQQTSASNTAYKTATWNNTGSPSLMMEGTINLVQAFGSMPSNIWVCAAAYATTNGGALVAQGPAAVTVNG